VLLVPEYRNCLQELVSFPALEHYGFYEAAAEDVVRCTVEIKAQYELNVK